MKLVHLFTDFSLNGPYVGEMKSIVCRNINNISCIDLMHDAPKFNPKASAYLLAACSRHFRDGDSCLAIVDPDVGSNQRLPLLIVADGVVYCGPDNGLLSMVIRKADKVTCYEIINIAEMISTTFHGRDVFAPALVKYLNKNTDDLRNIDEVSLVGHNWPDELEEIIYFDGYGNAVSGLQADTMTLNKHLLLNGIEVKSAMTFSSVKKNEPFWYTNSMGLVEIAVNQASAQVHLSLKIGQILKFVI